MKQKLTFMEILPIGLMLFASFFGAGNLIFPPALGQSAGVNFISAAAGFCTTGVGIPLLGIIAIGLLRASNPEALALPVHPKFAKLLIVVTVLTIGPFFAIPRTAAVSFDVGILPFISAENYDLGLVLYSLFFFVVTYFLSVNPSKIVDWVGKVLTPLLLISIAILVVQVFMSPMGAPQQAGGYYATMPYLKGFQEGYYTMDLLATMLFGTVVIDSIKVRGISEGSVLTKTCIMAGIIAAVLLAAIYFSLTYTGATSVEILGVSDNGAINCAFGYCQLLYGHCGQRSAVPDDFLCLPDDEYRPDGIRRCLSGRRCQGQDAVSAHCRCHLHFQLCRFQRGFNQNYFHVGAGAVPALSNRYCAGADGIYAG